ncbi:GDP-mannose 4,6-dehydratase [Patescibacteria group bacterium]|nr:GDP-mannose 4,6-dehydratase [Patescibacteria group bacterium]
MKKRILIIGGAGFIGINASEKFIKKGWKVTILDNLSRKGTDLNLEWLRREALNKFNFVKADIVTDLDILEKEIKKNDAVLHLAAQVAVTSSVKDPKNDFSINLVGTFHVLEVIRQLKKKPILLFSSTNKVYGDLLQIKVKEKESRYDFERQMNGVSEDTQLDFHSPYGCSKGGAEQYVRDYSRIFGLQTVVLRQSCIYGRHQFGIEDQGWVAWFMIATLLKKPIKLYGNGKQVRDILFVDDLVELYVHSIEKIKLTSGHIFNVGGGTLNSISILELFEKLKKNHGLEVKYKKESVRPGDQKIFISNNEKVTKITGWKPKINLDQGINEILKWTETNISLIKSLY